MKQDKSDNRNCHFPILHIMGLPGAGKTTLAKRLSRKLNLPIFQIGDYRSKCQSSPTGEADAWVALFMGLSRVVSVSGNGNSVLRTTWRSL